MASKTCSPRSKIDAAGLFLYSNYPFPSSFLGTIQLTENLNSSAKIQIVKQQPKVESKT